MAHFARVESDGTVSEVLVVPDEQESRGQEFLSEDLGLGGTWIQTSYSGRIRKQFAGAGHRYDAAADVFIAPRPFPSWQLDSNHDWQPPTPPPADNTEFYFWNEQTLAWENYRQLEAELFAVAAEALAEGTLNSEDIAALAEARQVNPLVVSAALAHGANTLSLAGVMRDSSESAASLSPQEQAIEAGGYAEDDPGEGPVRLFADGTAALRDRPISAALAAALLASGLAAIKLGRDRAEKAACGVENTGSRAGDTEPAAEHDKVHKEGNDDENAFGSRATEAF